MSTDFKPGQAYQHIEKGHHLESRGRLDEAMAEFKRAVQADPSIAAAHIALGHHYQRKGLLTKAVDEFHTAVLLSGDYESLFHWGRALADLERYDEAGEAFSRCLSIEDDEPSARYELACVQYAQDDFGPALTRFESLLEEYPDDWQLKSAIADCQLALGDYAAAESTLREAARMAPADVDSSALREGLLVAQRHREFSPSHTMGCKDLLYADHGIIMLGSGRDDGLDVPMYQNYTFTYRDVATTCNRMLAMSSALSWPLSAIVPVEEDSKPLAIALAQLLEVPALGVEELRDDDLALVVLAVGTQPELFEVTLEHMRCPTLSFALALAWEPHKGTVPDILGVHGSGKFTLPWKRLPKPSAEAAAASILRALAVAPEEENQAQQVAYYRRRHTLLRVTSLSTEWADCKSSQRTPAL
ncbi:MAG: tetratricopeptide repeat protein [Anaerolineales bacterium]|nr:MAG: tetratricopeptide repeat protein [Anaerolineales bacterium]